MSRFTATLLALALLPNAFALSQDPAVPPPATAMSPQISDEDVVPAAELEAAVTELESAYAQHHNVLVGLLDKAPEAARPALEQAIEKSKQGYHKARANRERTTAMRQEKANAKLAKAQGRDQQAPKQFGQFGNRAAQTGQGQAQPQSQGQLGQNSFGNRPVFAGQGNGSTKGQAQGSDQGKSRGREQERIGTVQGGTVQGLEPQIGSAGSQNPNRGASRR